MLEKTSITKCNLYNLHVFFFVNPPPTEEKKKKKETRYL